MLNWWLNILPNATKMLSLHFTWPVIMKRKEKTERKSKEYSKNLRSGIEQWHGWYWHTEQSNVSEFQLTICSLANSVHSAQPYIFIRFFSLKCMSKHFVFNSFFFLRLLLSFFFVEIKQIVFAVKRFCGVHMMCCLHLVLFCFFWPCLWILDSPLVANRIHENSAYEIEC